MSPEQTNNHAASELEQTIDCIKHGDLRAFRRLVESNQQYAFTLAFRIVCDEDDARDIVQEAFIRVWKHIQSFTPEVKFTTWLYRIVVNLSYDRLKGARRRKRLFVRMSRGSEISFPDAVAMDEEIVHRDLADKIEDVAKGLPLKQRMVFVLRDLQDLSVGEVAEILEMSPDSVKTNLWHARRHIRRRLERKGVYG